MSAGDQTWFLIDEHTAGKHTEEFILGCPSCLDLCKKGLAAAHQNYLDAKQTAKRNAEWGRKQYDDYMKLKLELKAKARKHRERAALNRENHRLLQNAHRKTLAKLRNKDRGNRLLMDANHRLRELERAVRKGMQDRPDLQADFDTVRDLLYTTAEYGLAVESAKAQAALFRIGLEMTRREPRPFYAASAPSAEPRLSRQAQVMKFYGERAASAPSGASDRPAPSPGSGPPTAAPASPAPVYGCSSHYGEEPWEDD